MQINISRLRKRYSVQKLRCVVVLSGAKDQFCAGRTLRECVTNPFPSEAVCLTMITYGDQV
jgi:enoyl-CoA hydratase/carnithine racemase